LSTIRKLVTKGFREAGIIEVGGEPDADELDEGLDLLQGLYSSFFGNELGEPLVSVNYGSGGLTNTYAIAEDQSPVINSVYVPENVRLVLNLEAAVTLYLHPNPKDGARLGILDSRGNLNTYNVTVNPNGRLFGGAASSVLNTASLNKEYFYRADLGDWKPVVDLALGDDSPLPREFDDFLTTALAIRLNPRYGAQTSQEVSDVLTRMKRQFRARYRQEQEVSSEDGITRLPSNPYWAFNSNDLSNFAKGR
jgi:hypothetical protein